MAAVLVVAWALGVAVSGAKLPWASREVRDSAVLQRVNGVMPPDAVEALNSFNDVVGSSFFPRYLEPFARERIIESARRRAGSPATPTSSAPQQSVLQDPRRELLRPRRRGHRLPLRPDRVMTNAHVVAGRRQAGRARRRERGAGDRVVYYNPDLDVAVLAVDGVRGPFLRFDRDGKPAAGRRRCSATRRTAPTTCRPPGSAASSGCAAPTSTATAPSSARCSRCAALVRPGNSGGPLVSSAGRVLGVIFAASVTDGDTGYALTAEPGRRGAAAGPHPRPQTVDTGDCA